MYVALVFMVPLIVSGLPYALLNPKIDLIDIKEEADTINNKWCQTVPCPRYKINPAKIPKPFEVRDYSDSYWLSTPWYQEVNGSCLGNREVLIPYYNNLLNYFEGLNSMGLRFERSRPVRIVSRAQNKDSSVMQCCVRFYIPDMYPMHPPASIVLDVIMGWVKERVCYVVGRTGEVDWANVTRVYKSMKSYLARLGREYTDTGEITVDVFSGYAVSDQRRYMEVLICNGSGY